VGMAPTLAYKIMRLEYAEFLLRKTEQTVTEIASATGFCDSSHFVRAFKERRGMTPSVFRRS
jgi:AraC-like DNA-binding protein